jgi:signal transduction histidine kinase
MRFFRRSLITLGVAAMLPTVVFAAVGVFYFLRAERARVEAETLRRSETVTMLVDAQLQRDIAALNVLTTSTLLESRDWAGFYARVRPVLSANPNWTTIALLDVERNEEIFDLRRKLAAPGPISALHASTLSDVIRTSAAAVGRVARADAPTAWVYVPVIAGGRVKYVFGAGIRPQVFQDILLRFAEPRSTAAVVDRAGIFVARTLRYEERVGTPATRYVRDAMRTGNRGFYRGTTYEGLKNYTAFHTSSWSGWSAHLAVEAAQIDTPTVWSFIVAGLAGLGSVGLGAILIVLALRDLAERRQAEEVLRQSQKMEAVGQLTGGIAHDFNNLLTAIIGNLDMIRTRVTGNERLQRMADNALESARRGAKLSSQLLAFSRTQRMSVGPVDLQQLLDGMNGLLAQSVGTAIQVQVHVDDDARFVESDANQLELALLNLAVNARDAMPDGGTLRMEARRAARVDSDLPQREYVNLSIKDNGSGMSDEVRARAVDPFFTTKPVGHGTGLGLSQVYGIVKESGGKLSIDSEPGRGTTVTLTLPAVAQPVNVAVSEESPPTVPKALREQRASILVVDDDRLVRRFMADSLRALEYDVLEADGGPAALAILAARTVDLLLIDFAMPGMNGAEVARAALVKQPQLRVLMVSGYADSAVVEAALGSMPQLRKPFDLAELGAAVAQTLQAR